jgi:curved DNA-binding protein CbpA
VKAEKLIDGEIDQALMKVLVDYHAAPGGYAISLGQPILAFQELGTVIAWAQGKISADQASHCDHLQKKALFFIQRSCLRYEGTHYDVMGLGRTFSLDALRLRYRALISLTHPDKNLNGLPADAAVRINKAYDTLKDADKRAKYDTTIPEYREYPAEQLESDQPIAPRNLQASFNFNNRRNVNSQSIKKYVAFSIAIFVLVFVGIVVATSQNMADIQLVEKRNPSTLPSYDLNATTANSRAYTDVIDQANLNRTLSETAQRQASRETSLDARATKAIAERSDRVLNPIYMTGTSVASKNQGIESEKARVVVAQADDHIELKMSRSIQMPLAPKSASSQLNDARLLVTQLISALESPKDTLIMHNKMANQGVSGNLFRLALPHVRQSGAVRVDQLLLKEKLENNRLIMNGSVVLWLGETTSQIMPYKYNVSVEFKDIENRLEISSFDLKEAR